MLLVLSKGNEMSKKTIKIAIALMTLLTTGCAVLQDCKAAVAYAYGGTAADFATTAYNLNQGCRETNPLMNTDSKIAIGALVSLGAVYLLDRNESPLWAHTSYWAHFPAHPVG